MLWAIIALLLLLWLLGLTLHAVGAVIHFLLVLALVLIAVNLLSGRRVV